jgi:Holliday junction resolvase-like predicted endonuclease
VFPEESVGAGKQRRLARLATAYVQHAKFEGDWRIDVIAIDRDGLRHIENAVSLW